MTTSTRQNLADRVLANGDRTLWDEADWQDYLEKAERLGIVQRSRSGRHDSSWSMITLLVRHTATLLPTPSPKADSPNRLVAFSLNLAGLRMLEVVTK